MSQSFSHNDLDVRRTRETPETNPRNTRERPAQHARQTRATPAQAASNPSAQAIRSALTLPFRAGAWPSNLEIIRMNALNRFFALVLICQFAIGPATFAQIVDINSPFGTSSGSVNVSGISNFKVVDQSADGSEVTLNFDYTYDGLSGPTAKIIAIIEKRGEKGISGWFGCDPAVVSKGSGPLSIRVRYFNDEFGVPPQFTSDRGRILFLNPSGISVVSSTPFIKTIKWGSADAKPADKPAPTPVLIARGDPETARKLAEEKRQAEAKALAEAKAREEAARKAQAEAQMLKEREERAMAEAKAREDERIKAEAEAKRLAEEKAIAEARAKKESEEREQARLKA